MCREDEIAEMGHGVAPFAVSDHLAPRWAAPLPQGLLPTSAAALMLACALVDPILSLRLCNWLTGLLITGPPKCFLLQLGSWEVGWRVVGLLLRPAGR